MLSSKKNGMGLLCVSVHVTGAGAAPAPQCHRCPAGKFKSPEMIFSRCTACPENTFSASPGAGRCEPCTNGTISRENSVACFCPNGTLTVDWTCTQIFSEGVKLSGFVDVPRGNASVVVDLEAFKRQLISGIAALYNISESLVLSLLQSTAGTKTDIYLLATDAEQHAQTVNQTAAVKPPIMPNAEQTIVQVSLNEGTVSTCVSNEISTGTTCVCAPGYTRVGSACVACAAGKVKAQTGDMACDTCTNNTFSTAGAVECAPCAVSSTAKEDHTSCVCNSGFVFYNKTCTAVESVHVRVSGSVDVTQGNLTVSQLEDLLLNGMSAFFNVPKDFIIMIIMQSMTSSTTPPPTSTTTTAARTTPPPTSTTTTAARTTTTSAARTTTTAAARTTPPPTSTTTSAAHTTTTSAARTTTTAAARTTTTSAARTTTTAAARTTTTPAPHNTSNSTRTGRRLLSVPTQPVNFTAVVQAISPSQLLLVQTLANATANLSTLLTNITEMNVSIASAQSVEAFVNDDGSRFDCPDGRLPIPNVTTWRLVCRPPLPPKPPDNTVLVATLVVVIFVVLVLGGAYNYHRIRDWLSYTAVPTAPPDAKPPTTLAPGIQTMHASFLDSFCRTANLQFPATVAIEYHLIPSQST